jgi:hypothetical protein
LQNDYLLLALDVPVVIAKLEDDEIKQLPRYVHRLYIRLQDIDDREEFIPGLMRDEV